MASVADLEIRLDSLETSLAAAQTRVETEQRNVERWQQRLARAQTSGDQAQIAELEQQLARSQQNLATAQAALENRRQRVEATRAELEQARAQEQQQKQAEAAEAAIANEKSSPKNPENTLPPTQSAAADVANSAAGATQNPAPPPTSTGRLTTTEADRLAARTESGTNPPVKTLAQTQSVPPATPTTTATPAAPAPGTAAATEGRPGGETGAGALGEDGATAANTKQVLDTVGNKPFQPRDNVLDQYASYTYNIGWYILTPSQYAALQNTAKPSISQYNLLMQSGGAPENVSGVKPELTDASGRRTGASDPRSTTFVGGDSTKAGRNPFFGLDYYLDNLEITSLPVGKGTNRANNDASLKFTVTEPANITLINNLYLAVKELYADPKVPVLAAYYALVIRFYGYDERGNIVQARNSDNNDAVVEKIIPFRLSNIEFEVSNKLVEYQVTGVGVPYNMGFGSNLGVIKSKIELSGATVKDMLTKGVDPTAVSASDGRQTTASAPGIQPGVGINPVQADDTFNQNQADTLNLLAAGGLGA